MLGKLELSEECEGILDRHQHQVSDRFSIDFYIAGIFAEASPPAIWTGSASTKPGKHYPVLNFVGFALEVFEKGIQSFEVLISGPKQFLFFFGEFVEGSVNRKVKFDSFFQERF